MTKRASIFVCVWGWINGIEEISKEVIEKRFAYLMLNTGNSEPNRKNLPQLG